MITITIDYNNDKVEIEKDDKLQVGFKYSANSRDIESIVFMILNEVNSKNVKLVRVNEDKRTTIEEW